MYNTKHPHRIKSCCCYCHSRWVVALACPEANPSSTGARAGAIFAPGAPDAVLFDLIRVFPHAVTFVAPLQRMMGERKKSAKKKTSSLDSVDDNGGKKWEYTTRPNVCGQEYFWSEAVSKGWGYAPQFQLRGIFILHNAVIFRTTVCF